MDTSILTGSNILIALIVLIAVAEIFNLILKTAQNIKQMRKPSDDIARTVAEHTTMLSRDKKRLDSMEEGQRALCSAIVALMNHEITGNSIEKLKQAKDELTDYLISR